MSYLCVATEAAASRANCLMALSSRYFCSHLVMSASRARMRSSFSLRCSIRALALYSGAAPVLWELPCLCSHTHTHTHPHTHTHAHTHTPPQCRHHSTHTLHCAHTHPHTHSYTHTPPPTHPPHPPTQSLTHTHSHTHTHTHTQRHT